MPTPPSTKENFFVAGIFLISAEGKYVGAAEVALATSLMKKSFYLFKSASVDLKITSLLSSLLTAVIITLVSSRISDSLQSLK